MDVDMDGKQAFVLKWNGWEVGLYYIRRDDGRKMVMGCGEVDGWCKGGVREDWIGMVNVRGCEAWLALGLGDGFKGEFRTKVVLVGDDCSHCTRQYVDMLVI